MALNDRDEHDLDAMAREITVATRLVIVCNPNNPTSTALPGRDAIAAFVEQVPRHVCVIVDEAYCEFNTLDDPDTTLDLLKRHRNVVLLRTFSKVYGLCGLRVGFGLCGSDEFVTAVNQVRQPFFCNAAAQAAAIEALRHQDEVNARVERTIVARVEVEDGLRELGIEPAESQANFCWFDLPVPDGEEPAEVEARVVRGLGERGVLVRAGNALGRAGALRVTYGTPGQNARFLRELGALLYRAGPSTSARWPPARRGAAVRAGRRVSRRSSRRREAPCERSRAGWDRRAMHDDHRDRARRLARATDDPSGPPRAADGGLRRRDRRRCCCTCSTTPSYTASPAWAPASTCSPWWSP